MQYNAIHHPSDGIPPPQAVSACVQAAGGVTRVVVALSGGVDSVVLLHAAVAAGLPCPVAALHVHHGLSVHADAWQTHCAALCDALSVPLVCASVRLEPGGGLEQAARLARYDAFAAHLQPGDLLLLAHHQQDQLETFFLRLARGAGVRGLAAMPQGRPLGAGRLARPLLAFPKAALLAYAEQHQLRWVEDDSNAETRFDRNFLRLQVLPLLQARWPALAGQVSGAVAHLRATEDLLAEYAAEDLQACAPRAERLGHSLLLAPWLAWSGARRHAVVRHWLATLGYRAPEHKQLAQLPDLLHAGEDRNPLLDWRDCELRRYRDRIYCLPGGWRRSVANPPLVPARLTLTDAPLISVDASLALADGSRLSCHWVSGCEGLDPAGEYRVLPRHATAFTRAHPHGRAHSQSLKKLLQEHGLVPWLRDSVPVIVQGDRLAAVADLWVERDFACRHERVWQLRWDWPQVRSGD